MPLDDRDDAEHPKRRSGRFVLGLFGLLGLILSALLLGFNPLSFLGGGETPRVDQAQKVPEQDKAPGTYGCEDQSAATAFACRILASANATWAKAFPPGRYQGPELVFYTRQGRSGCSTAPMASPPRRRPITPAANSNNALLIPPCVAKCPIRMKRGITDRS